MAQEINHKNNYPKVKEPASPDLVMVAWDGVGCEVEKWDTLTDEERKGERERELGEGREIGTREKDHSTPHQPLISSLVIRPTDSGGVGGGGATGADGGDFTKISPWFSSEARKLVTKMLDPNPNTRISISKIMDSSWFKKTLPKSLRSKEEQEFAVDDEVFVTKGKETETLNAFHIISLSQGFDLSPLFEEKMREEKEELRFATAKPASSVISTLEQVAKTKNFSVKRSNSCVRLQGPESGRKGKLGIAADIFPLAPSFVVVEVKKASGDTLEFNQFCSKELRPALKDVAWTTPAGHSLPA